MPTIAIIEDEHDLRDSVAEFLIGRGLEVRAAANAAEFRDIAMRERIDVTVLDIQMPGEDGLSLACWLRTLSPPPGIIFATASGAPIDRVVGLELGADDYLVKPYELRELLARIRSVLRRPAEAPRSKLYIVPEASRKLRTLRIGDCLLDLDSRRLSGGDGRLIELTAMEVDLLEALAKRPNRILTRAQLLELAPGREDGDDERSIDVRVARLRRKLEATPDIPRLIRTIRGEGYMFVPEGT
jgi:two-component system phosphate regulon response regulator OmpR